MIDTQVDVETDLAASIVATWQAVRDGLSEQQPRVGHIEAQARTAWNRHRAVWRAFTRDAADHLAAGASAAYVDQLGDLLATAASQGLAAGMDIQLGRGQNPEVAWQRVLAGYGLDVRTMRGLLGGAQAPNSAGGAGAAPDSLARTAVRTLLRRAESIARKEVRAWSAAEEEVAKAYNRAEPRDGDGRWARMAAAQVKEREPDEVDTLLGRGVAEEAPAAVETEDKYARADKYAAAGKYAGVAAPAEPVDDKYDKYSRAAAAATEPKYAPAVDPAKYAQRQLLRRTLILVAGVKAPDGPPPPPPGGGGEMHVPMQDLVNMLTLPSMRQKSANLFSMRRIGADVYIDFARIQGRDAKAEAAAENVAGTPTERLRFAPTRVQARFSSDPLRSIQPDLPELDPQPGAPDWQDLTDKARPIWEEVRDNPADYVDGLDSTDLDVIWRNSGGNPLKAGDVKGKIRALQDVLDTGHQPADPSLLDAFADRVTWVRPRLAGNDGAEFQRMLDDSYSEADLDDYVPPGVLIFPEGLADGEKPEDLKDIYRVHTTEYVSGFRAYGSSVPEGIIGAQKIYVVPVPDNDPIRIDPDS